MAIGASLLIENDKNYKNFQNFQLVLWSEISLKIMKICIFWEEAHLI